MMKAGKKALLKNARYVFLGLVIVYGFVFCGSFLFAEEEAPVVATGETEQSEDLEKLFGAQPEAPAVEAEKVVSPVEEKEAKVQVQIEPEAQVDIQKEEEKAVEKVEEVKTELPQKVVEAPKVVEASPVPVKKIEVAQPVVAAKKEVTKVPVVAVKKVVSVKSMQTAKPRLVGKTAIQKGVAAVKTVALPEEDEEKIIEVGEKTITSVSAQPVQTDIKDVVGIVAGQPEVAKLTSAQLVQQTQKKTYQDRLQKYQAARTSWAKTHKKTPLAKKPLMKKPLSKLQQPRVLIKKDSKKMSKSRKGVVAKVVTK